MGGNDSSDVQQEINDDDTDIFELITFNLSPVLGGRSEVMATPFIETLKHLELQLKRIEQNRYNGFMDLFFSNRQNFDPKKGGQAIQEYIKAIQPKKEKKPMAMKTDINQLLEMKRKQEERARKQSEQGG